LGQTLEPGKEAVRFSAKPGFAFPPSDISKLTPASGGGPVGMEVTFMGLIGPSGVLPNWYNELVVERIRNKDFSLGSFLDMFHHRLVSLFYLAWKKYRFQENYITGARDRHSGYLLSLAGLGTPELENRIGLPKDSLNFYIGLLGRSVPSVVAVEATVEYFADTAARVDQFIERTLSLSPEDQTQVGMANARLGVDTICGSLVRECRTKFRVNLGPMSYVTFMRFLPAGEMFGPIFALIRYMAGIEFEFDVRVFLKREEVPACILGVPSPTAPRLGLSTWIKAPDFFHEQNPYVTFEESQFAG
jgi:type VI secretion system protein ImpH